VREPQATSIASPILDVGGFLSIDANAKTEDADLSFSEKRELNLDAGN